MGADGSLFEVDTDDLRATGSALLGVGDGVEASGCREALGARDLWGHRGLTGAGGRFADRFGYLVEGLGLEIVSTGQSLRGKAYGYEECDWAASVNLAPPDDW